MALVLARVYRNITEILTKVADQNVWSTQTVPPTKLASIINAKTLARVLAVQMPNVIL